MPSDTPTSRARTLTWLALAFAGLLLVAACGSEDASTELAGSAADGGPAEFPRFTAATVDGSQLEFGSLEGQDTVLWFWAPW